MKNTIKINGNNNFNKNTKSKLDGLSQLKYIFYNN